MSTIIRTRQRQSGFTLIELVIVVVILGILAAVAIPRFADTTTNARQAVQDSTLGALKSAWSVYYGANRAFPTAAQLAAQMGDPTCTAPSTTTISCGVNNAAGTNTIYAVALTANNNSTVGSSSDITLPAGNR